jgi:CHAT domain-containing protein
MNASPESGKGAEQRNLKLIRQDIQTAAPDLSSLVTVSSVALEAMQARLAPGEQLLEFYYQDGALFAFLLDGKAVQGTRLDGDGLAKLVQAFRSAVESPATNDWVAPAKALHARLIKPIEPLLTASRLIIVPHGALHYLPFGALMAENGSLLIDRHTLRMLPAASVITLLKPVLADKTLPILAFGNPDLGDARLDLAFAESEARTVAGLVKGSRLLLRQEASEGNFRRAAGLFSRIHFATHGKFQAESPLDSGLYLARDAEHDGVLTVSELYSMQLNADLVTLSACETGLGKVDNGDDVVGLARGFLYAGARSVVSSLWSVDDKATEELMRAFYANLAGTSRAEALRSAQLKARGQYPHPFHWAAFQLTGRAD